MSVGVVDGRPMLDLEYIEDSAAEIDFNVVATGDGEIIEVQGTGEKRSFCRRELDVLLDLALGGIRDLIAHQRQVWGRCSPRCTPCRRAAAGARRATKRTCGARRAADERRGSDVLT